MLTILKCYHLDRKQTYRCYYNERLRVVFKSKISVPVGKMTEKTDVSTLYIFYVSGTSIFQPS